MSLYKQLWISLLLIMTVSFLGSFIVSCMSARAYLEEQLFLKNVDNANSLAITLSGQAGDRQLIELYVNSQYDTGHYQFIQLLDVDGETIAAHFDKTALSGAPKWLESIFPINVKPGVAYVSNGWQKVGTLTLSSHVKFVYKQLWDTAIQLLTYFILMFVMSSLIGSIILRRVIRPLAFAVDQAEAISERRFIEIEVPKTREFKLLISSMNTLSRRVKAMLLQETAQLENLRQKILFDQVTGFLNREPALNHFNSLLAKHDENSKGHLIIFRIHDLFQLNKQEGRLAIDAMLRVFSHSLTGRLSDVSQLSEAGRLNGSDFIVILPNFTQSIEDFSEAVLDAARRCAREAEIDGLSVSAVSSSYSSENTIGELLSKVDTILSPLQKDSSRHYIHIKPEDVDEKYSAHGVWEERLERALAEEKFVFELYPTCSNKHQILHYEAPIRLVQEDGEMMNAGLFMPHVSRLGLGGKLDLVVVELAVKTILENPQPIGINLSSDALSDLNTIEHIVGRVKSLGERADLLWVELPEYAVFHNLEGFKTLCRALVPLKCKLGIEHLHQDIVHIGELHDLGLTFVKVDRALTHGIDQNTSYQILLHGLCTIVHSIGLLILAEGVNEKEEWETLMSLGFDGGTGVYVSHSDKLE